MWIRQLLPLCFLACGPVGEAILDVGESCSHDLQCQSDLCLHAADGWPGGMCAGTCDHCTGADVTCVSFPSGGLCLPTCSGSGQGDCRDGYVCSPVVDACLPDCRLGWSCGQGFVCGASDGLCQVPTAPGAPVGTPCLVGADCASSLCIAETPMDSAKAWPGGACAGLPVSGACADGTTPFRLGDTVYCLAACDEAAPCRDGYVCSDGACLPDCNGGIACGAGYVCSADGLCRPEAGSTTPVGGECLRPTDCASGVCFTESDGSRVTGWTNGMCSAVCVKGKCGNGNRCVPLDGQAWCLPACGGGCRDGYVCSADLDVCLPDCNQGWACGDGYLCGSDGQCSPAPFEGGAVGDACDSSASCTSGVCFPAQRGGKPTGWTGGTCSELCKQGQCAAGQTCVPLGGQAWCLPSCAGGCRQGYVCNTESDVCLPDCNAGWPCGDGYACGANGVCKPSYFPQGSVGATCSGPADCASGVCFAATQNGQVSGWTGGMCGDVCKAGGVCPTGAACVPLGQEAWCLPRCNALTPCRAGYVCDVFGVCLPNCNNPWDCGQGYVCQPDGHCTPQLPPGELIGGPCTSSTQCATPAGPPGVCNTSWPQGMCTQPCGPTACPPTAQCVPVNGQGQCLPRCGPLKGCRPGYVCDPTSQVCHPPCQSGTSQSGAWSCGALTCQASGLCG